MSYETEAFADIIRLTNSAGKVPAEIPGHYWRFCWTMRRAAKGLKAPKVSWTDVAVLSKPIALKALS